MTVRHVITLQPPVVGVQLYVCCSCSDEPIARVGFGVAPASLVEVNEIAHQHIQAAEGPEPAFAPRSECRCSVSMGMARGPHASWCPAFSPRCTAQMHGPAKPERELDLSC